MSDIEYDVIQSEDESGKFKVPKKSLTRKGTSRHPKQNTNSAWALTSDEDYAEEPTSKSKKIIPKAVKKQRARKASPVSDEELEEEPISKSKKIKTKAVKNQRARQATPLSDDGLEEELTSKSKKIKTKAADKLRASEATPESNPGWFSNWGDEEDVEAQRRASSASALSSVLTRRVPGGYVRRTASLTGDLFIELKLYYVNDIQNVSSQDRWDKALVNLKYRVNSNSTVVAEINKVLKICKDDFTEEATFFPDKINK